MVYLNRIYTRSGDSGETSLGDGTRVSKTHARIQAYGGTDELNASLGVVLIQPLPDLVRERLTEIQNDLFDLGADLCVPEKVSEVHEAAQPSALRVTADQVTRLESWIDEANEPLESLTSFILPGGTPAAAFLHQSRTICRRVEVQVLKLAREEPVNPQVVIYLNRLADLLFVLARSCNDQGKGDILWVPGQNRASQQGTEQP